MYIKIWKGHDVWDVLEAEKWAVSKDIAKKGDIALEKKKAQLDDKQEVALLDIQFKYNNIGVWNKNGDIREELDPRTLCTTMSEAYIKTLI